MYVTTIIMSLLNSFQKTEELEKQLSEYFVVMYIFIEYERRS